MWRGKVCVYIHHFVCRCPRLFIFTHLKIFSNFSSHFFFWPNDFLVCSLISIYLWIFQFFFCFWILASFHCGQWRYFLWFQSFKISWELFYDLIYDLSWGMFHVLLTGMCFLLLLNEVCSVSVRSRWFIMFKSTIFSLIFCLDILSIIKSGALRSLKSYRTQKEELQTKTLAMYLSMYLPLAEIFIFCMTLIYSLVPFNFILKNFF